MTLLCLSLLLGVISVYANAPAFPWVFSSVSLSSSVPILSSDLRPFLLFFLFVLCPFSGFFMGSVCAFFPPRLLGSFSGFVPVLCWVFSSFPPSPCVRPLSGFYCLRPFSGFYKAREGPGSLPPATADIVEESDCGWHRGRDLLDFSVELVFVRAKRNDEQCFPKRRRCVLWMTVFQFGL